MKTTSWIVSPAPFILSRPTVSRMSVITLATLTPILAMLAVAKDYAALLTVAASLAGCLAAEAAGSYFRGKNTFGDGTAILAGVLVGLLLPSGMRVFVSFAAAFTGFFIARVAFGGLGAYWIHPVAVSVCVAYVSQAAFFPPPLITAEGIRQAGDAFAALKLDKFAQLPTDQGIASFLNANAFSLFGIRLPEGYVTLLWNAPSAIPAFRYNILVLLASIVLIAMDIADWIVPSAFLVTYGASVWFLSPIPFGGAPEGGNVLFAVLTSGVLFTAFYVLSDFSASPRTRIGKLVSGFVAGLAAFAICGPGGSSIGAAFTVIVTNAVNPVIEYAENRAIASAEDIA